MVAALRSVPPQPPSPPSPHDPDPDVCEADTLGRRALSGTALSLFGQLASQSLRLGSNLILTRLLAPEAFGLMAIVLAVTTGLQLISDVGIWQAIVRSPRGEDRAFLNTAFTFTAVRGAALFVIGCAAALPASVFYAQPDLLWLLPLCSLQALIAGLESTKLAVAARKLAVGKIMAVDLGAQIVALVAALVVGFATRSVIALACASLAAVAVRTLLSHVAVSGEANRFGIERAALREIFTFGGWIFVSTILYFVGTRWDVLALGRLESVALLGVYGLATMIIAVPIQLSEKVTGYVLMPALAERFRADPRGLAGDVRRARALLFPAGAALFLGAAMAAPAFFELLYRDAYVDAGWMTQLLVAVGWFALLQDASSRALLALGDSRGIAAANFVRVAATIGFTALGFTVGGFLGFMVGTMIGAAVGAVALGVVLHQHGVRVLDVDAAATLLFLVLLGVGCALPYWLAPVAGVRVSFVTLMVAPVLLLPLVVVAAVRTRRALRT